MIRSKDRIIRLLIKIGDVILDTKLGKKVEKHYREFKRKSGKSDKGNRDE